MFLTLFFILLTTGCQMEDMDSAPEKHEIAIELNSSGVSQTKSVLGGDVDYLIKNVLVAAYDAETKILEESRRFTSNSGISLELMPGRSYHMYALVNMPELEAPEHEEEMLDITYMIPSFAEMRAIGLPMSGKNLVMEKGDESCSIDLEFLVAKMILTFNTRDFYAGLKRLDATYEDGNKYSMTHSFKAYARQLNRRLKPFGVSAALSSSDIFSVETDYELEVDRANRAVFYIPENMQGELLPGNTDVYRKIPGNLSSEERSKCTFINVTFSHSSVHYGVEGEVSYNFYPGENQTSNFDIHRNKAYLMEFTPKLKSLDKADGWMISVSDWNDSRNIIFNEDFYMVNIGETLDVQVKFRYNNLYHYGLGGGNNDWTLYMRLSGQEEYVPYTSATDLGLKSVTYTYKVDKFTIDTGSLPEGTSIELKAESFDHKHAAFATIKVVSPQE